MRKKNKLNFSKLFKNKKVLITGHTGFKGSWLTSWLLLLGAKVTGLSINVPSNPSHFKVIRLKDKINHKTGKHNDIGINKYDKGIIEEEDKYYNQENGNIRDDNDEEEGDENENETSSDSEDESSSESDSSSDEEDIPQRYLRKNQKKKETFTGKRYRKQIISLKRKNKKLKYLLENKIQELREIIENNSKNNIFDVILYIVSGLFIIFVLHTIVSLVKKS